MTSPPPVGLIGIGVMGMQIARRLHEKGYPLVVRDVRPEAEAEAAALGLSVCATPRELARRVELVIIVVVDAAQIDEVLFGANGVTSQSVAGKTIILCSTIAAEDAARIGARLESLGAAAIDGPISGGPARARDGSMSMMLAARAEVLERWLGVLDAMSSRRFIVGASLGDGARMKLVNNLLAGINLVAAAEGFALGIRLGLDPRRMYEVICASSGASWVFQDRMARVLEDDFEAHAFAHILAKDLGLATMMARTVGHATPLGDAALARFQETLARGWSRLDDAAVIKTYLGEAREAD